MTELRKSFHSELDEVHAELMRIGAKVIEAIPRATRVLLDSDLEAADYMIQGDDEIDARCIEVEEHCYRVLALQAPVDSDLRSVITALKMAGELERSDDGDAHAAYRCAKFGQRVTSTPRSSSRRRRTSGV